MAYNEHMLNNIDSLIDRNIKIIIYEIVLTYYKKSL